jgi:hypothetical protein
MCKKCERKKVKLEGTISRMKLLMKELNESLSKLKKEGKREDGKEWLVTAETLALLTPVSLVEEDHEKWLCSPIDLDYRSRLLEYGENQAINGTQTSA